MMCHNTLIYLANRSFWPLHIPVYSRDIIYLAINLSNKRIIFVPNNHGIFQQMPCLRQHIPRVFNQSMVLKKLRV